MEWADTLVIGTNFFSDPRGNVLNIEFEERLLADRKFVGGRQILDFYGIDDAAYICTLYCGDRYFRLRVFDVHWKEVHYPAVGNSGGSRKLCKLSCSPRFFQCFRLMVDTSKVTIFILVYYYFVVYICVL